MSRTGFFPDPAELAPCHVRENGGFAPTLARAANARPQGPISGGGGLSGTAPRLSALPAHDPERRRTRRRAGARRGGARRDERGRKPATTGPASSGSVAAHLCLPFDLFPEQATAFGLGFLINPEPVPGRRAAGSLAWAGLANCYYWAIRRATSPACCSTQLFPFGDPKMLALLAELETAAYAASGRR